MEIVTRKEAKLKGLKRFYTGRACNRGHTEERYTTGGQCLGCERLRDSSRLEYKRKLMVRRYAESPEIRGRVAATSKKNWKEYSSRAEVVEHRKVYYEKTKDLQVAKACNYYQVNKALQNAKQNSRRKANPIKWIARSMLSAVLKKVKLTKEISTETLLGYSSEELKVHLEGLFREGMQWSNHGEWHVDHIKPISAFIREGITCMKTINSLTNLQPLWARENLTKQAKWEVPNNG